ncbi:hypothetical protein QCA50_002635 [Cerrena zonata]|uniref:AN1-type domain-containing protein n=1 Tax=Cerrena zonata TaxID=2478898 RepID=A0AAW0GUM6_9APHY
MSSTTPEIGAHCSLPSCNINDFLPIRCRCDQLFCREHIRADFHSCSVIQTSGVDINDLGSSSSLQPLQKCAASGCTKPSLEAFVSDEAKGDPHRVAAVCPRCQLSFCVSHRDISAHSCTAEDPKESAKAEVSKKNATARQLLAKHFPQAQTNSSSKLNPVVAAASGSTPMTAKKAAQLRQIQAMKLRHKAQPGDPRDKGKVVALGDKLHVLVSLEGGNVEPKAFWFRKTAGTGKTLDLLGTHFGLTGSQPTYLHKKVEDGTELLQNDKNLEEQIKDGDELVIKR